MFKNFFVLITVSLLSVGCAKTEEQKAKEKVDDTNTKISQMNNIIDDLSSGGVTLLKWGQGCRISGTLTKADKTTAGQKLQNLSRLGREVLAAEKSGGIFLTGGGDIEDVVDSANKCYNKL